MAVHFHPLKVKRIINETADCVSVLFGVPAELGQLFQYREGQNITIKKKIDGCELRRSYSLCTAPHEGEIKVAIKKVEGGLFSTFANEALKEGDVLEVLPPTGKFNAKAAANSNGQYLAIAAGSGITPVISIIKHTLHTQPQSRFTLVYGNKSRSSIIFFEELEGLKNRFMQRFNLINILSREKTEASVNHGRIDEEKLRELQPLISYQSFNSIYLCGPGEMIFCAKDFFKKLGIDEQKIHFELFSTAGINNKNNPPVILDSSENAQGAGSITIKLDGRSFSFKLAQNGPAILDAALLQGADLPYACKAGVCCTCRAKLISGKVAMDANFALEPAELADGFILTCQSHPLTENVLIDFDIK
jgi:ring-1,2-phenylacetyl-CoA epoxidase subunit PaaE